MKNISLRMLFCVWGFLGAATGCMTTSANLTPEPENEIPIIDEVGLEDGRTNYSWITYKGTIPFSYEASESSAVTVGQGGVALFDRPRAKAGTRSKLKAKSRKVAKNP